MKYKCIKCFLPIIHRSPTNSLVNSGKLTTNISPPLWIFFIEPMQLFKKHLNASDDDDVTRYLWAIKYDGEIFANRSSISKRMISVSWGMSG